MSGLVFPRWLLRRAHLLLASGWLGLVIGLPGRAGGQTTTAVVHGVVQGPGGAPVEFATLTLHRAADSAVVKTEFSDASGAFQLAGQAGMSYRLSAAQVGFERYWSPPFELPAAGLTLPPLALRTSAATALQEVTVIGRKPLFERLADRTVVNVEGSTLAAGNTALDVLARAPGVTVDGSDNLALRGKQGLLVLIDGKRQPMSGTQLADYLRALPAEQLKSLELITSPPASYDAQGGAGIIAINLKKDQRQGTNGSVNASYGRGEYGRLSTGLALNYRHGKAAAFGSYTYADRGNYVRALSRRDFFEQGQLTGTSDQEDFVVSDAQSHSWKAGLDYQLASRTMLGIAANGLALHRNEHGTNNLALLDAAGTPVSRLLSAADRATAAPTWAANLNLKHAFADSSNSPSLAADLNYARYQLSRQQGLTPLPEAGATAPGLLSGDQQGRLALQTAQLDFVQPLAQRRQLAAGLKVSGVHSDNDVAFWRTMQGVRTVDSTQTNRFRYDEYIAAAYLSARQTGARTTWQAGLRGEFTAAHGVQEVGSARFARQYVQLFPSAQLTYKVSARHELALALSRRIDRPTYDQLNPFREYLNPTTYRTGNVTLLPQTSYNAEVTHTFLQKYSTGLSYSNTHNPIVGVVQPTAEASRQVVSRPVNFTSRHYLALTLTVPLEPRKGWSIYNSAVVYYSRYVGALAGTALNRAQPALNLSSTHTLALNAGWTLDLSARYQSPEVYGFARLRASGELAAGVQKSLWKHQGTLKLNVTDILYTARNPSTATYGNLVTSSTQFRDSRVATLSFSYRFGNDQLPAARRRPDSAEEEKRRAAAGQ